MFTFPEQPLKMNIRPFRSDLKGLGGSVDPPGYLPTLEALQSLVGAFKAFLDPYLHNSHSFKHLLH